MYENEASKFGSSALWMLFLSLMAGGCVGQIVAESILGALSGAALTVLASLAVSQPFRRVAVWFVVRFYEDFLELCGVVG